VKENRRKSVCYVCYRKFPDTNFEHYSSYVSDHGYDVTILSYLDKGQEAFEERDGRKVYRFPLLSSVFSRKSKIAFARLVLDFINANSFSIVHVHHTAPYFFLYKLFAKHRSRFIFHTTSFPISESRLRTRKRIIVAYLQCLLMDMVIIQSEELRERLPGIRRMAKTRVVPVGFDGRLFYPAREEEKREYRVWLGHGRDELLLIYCGSMAPSRKLQNLILAFAEVCSHAKKVKLLMVGDGSGKADLENLVSRLGLQGEVVFTGPVPHDEMRMYICACDIGISYVPVNESYNYNPPLKTFEYFACGIPVIGTRTESNTKIITEDVNGLLTNDGPKETAVAILNLVSDNSKRANFARNAEYSIKQFDFKVIVQQQLVPAYEALLRA